MKPVLLVFALWSGMAMAEEDPWLGADKALHFSASAALSAGGYGVSAIWVEPIWARMAIGGGVALTAGILKESYDLTGRGHASWKDMTWNVMGAATGILVAWGIDRLVEHLSRPESPKTVPQPRAARMDLHPL